MFLSRGDRDLGVAFQTHPGRQAFISSGSKEPRSALESRRVSLGAHRVDSRESSLLRRLERGREIDRKSTRLNSSHQARSYAVFCLKKKKKTKNKKNLKKKKKKKRYIKKLKKKK